MLLIVPHAGYTGLGGWFLFVVAGSVLCLRLRCYLQLPQNTGVASPALLRVFLLACLGGPAFACLPRGFSSCLHA